MEAVHNISRAVEALKADPELATQERKRGTRNGEDPGRATRTHKAAMMQRPVLFVALLALALAGSYPP